MANNIQAQASLAITDSTNGMSASGRKTVSIEQTGKNYRADVENVTTAAAALTFTDLADIRYAYLQNPATAATITVTTAAIVLKPGDVMLFPPSTTGITVQATGACEINKVLTEA